MDLLERARSLAPRLVEIRRDIHRHPELSFREHRTSALAAAEVEEAGFSVRTGIARTGVVAEIDNGPGPTVALRADMDALPIQEENDVSYASATPGVMHACGHDFHTAGLIGAGRLLAQMKSISELPPGRIRLLFQPSEETADDEGKSGGMRMVDEGAMEGVDAVVGLHVGAHLPAGRVFLRDGPFFAGSDEIEVVVEGRSAHAARPHDGIDAVALAALGIVAAQQVVSRRIAPAANGVVTFGTVHGGTAPNVIAERVVVTGTLRYFENEIRDTIQQGVRDAFRTVEALGARTQVTFSAGYPPVVNDPRISGWVREAAAPLLAEDGFLSGLPTMEAEDFAFLSRAAPGAFFWLGAAPETPRKHHRPDFDIDESVLPLGSALLAASAAHLLRQLPEGSQG